MMMVISFAVGGVSHIMQSRQRARFFMALSGLLLFSMVTAA